MGSKIWDNHFVDADAATKHWDVARRIFLTPGPPTRPDVAAVAGTVFVGSVVLLLIIRPPMAMGKSKDDYHVPGVSLVAVGAWATLAALMGATLRYYWN